MLRPYGGMACSPCRPSSARRSARRSAPRRPAGAGQGARGRRLDAADARRPAARSADWTHEHADAANTRVSKDRVVKAPLGLLWFGGTSNDGILPRHGHGPQPQVIDGRLFIEGVDMMRALDIYTGRLLWETKLPGVGRAYDNMLHQPGANAGGSNYVSTPDGIYVAYGKSVVRLDPATGRAHGRVPPAGAAARRRSRPTCRLRRPSTDNYLVAGTNSLKPEARAKAGAVSSSENLVVMDRQTGPGALDRGGPERLPPQRHLPRRRPALRHRPAVGRPPGQAAAPRRRHARQAAPRRLRPGDRPGSLEPAGATSSAPG